MKLLFRSSSKKVETAQNNMDSVGRTARFLIPLAIVGIFSAIITNATAQNEAAPALTGDAPKGNAQNGKQLFARYGCYECHGREAQGGGLNGPRLAPDPFPFVAFQQFVRHPQGEMPPFTTKVVPDKDLVDIYAFLSSQPQPPPVSSIPILRP